MMAKIVVALGGNALGKSPQEQLELVKNTAKSLVGLITKGHEIVISHGNGPQVGSINLGLNYAAEHNQGPAFPFAECGAMTAINYKKAYKMNCILLEWINKW